MGKGYSTFMDFSPARFLLCGRVGYCMSVPDHVPFVTLAEENDFCARAAQVPSGKKVAV